MRRRFLFAIIILLAPTFVDAQRLPKRDCGMERAWASLAMQMRQMGATMEEQLPLATPNIGGSKVVLVQAYRVPRYVTPARRAKAAEEFGRQIEKSCRRNSK
jgi:hypothetical protein